MTTPQPNPTDDLEAAKAWAERTLRNGLLDRPEDDTHLRTLINNLRPAGVGDLEVMEWTVMTNREFSPVPSLNGHEQEPLRIHTATPAHPDAALMERVRNGLHDLRSWLRCDVPAGTIGATIALRTVNQLLSDLKAEAGR